MNKAPTKKMSVEAISENHTFMASLVDSQDIRLTAGQPQKMITHVNKIKLPVGGEKKLCLPTKDGMTSHDLTRQSVSPHIPAVNSTHMDSPFLSPGLPGAMDKDTAFQPSLPQLSACCRHVHFPKGA
ncbi:hypothetical protein E2C01_024827 [Portunus trituberculatus]|uniref:Uncharacterized protein n=1 Tax=Portunus trituberculatus TaxID=210409 RepID=A0A5B7EG78_PORTR|nr:hypothetical protein [Portunus trituberculatus]